MSLSHLLDSNHSTQYCNRGSKFLKDLWINLIRLWIFFSVMNIFPGWATLHSRVFISLSHSLNYRTQRFDSGPQIGRAKRCTQSISWSHGGTACPITLRCSRIPRSRIDVSNGNSCHCILKLNLPDLFWGIERDEKNSFQILCER